MNTSNFLSLPAAMFEDQEILVFGEHRATYAELLSRVRRLASALSARGVAKGDRVGVLATNSHQYVECYYAAAIKSTGSPACRGPRPLIAGPMVVRPLTAGPALRPTRRRRWCG